MKQELKQILVWLVLLIVVAAAVYYFFTPAGPYLEGFATKYPTSSTYENTINAIHNLYFLKNNKRLESKDLVVIITDISNICPVPKNNFLDEMPTECFDAIVKKLDLNTGIITSPENINLGSAENIITVLNRRLGLGYSSLTHMDIGKAIKMQPDLSNVCVVSSTGTITKECYNALINAFVINANKDGVVCSTSDVEETKTEPKSLLSDIKDTTKTIGTSTSNAASILTPSASGKPTEMSGGSYSAKCTVQFGNDAAVSPQTKAATEKPIDKTCGTTGDVAKTTKTPAVEQGCEFAQKFPKVNVINLRDYVHKDEVPCWSCKL